MIFDELRHDIEEHIEHETRDNIDRGMTPKQPAPPRCESSAIPPASPRIPGRYGTPPGSIACSRTSATHSEYSAAIPALRWSRS